MKLGDSVIRVPVRVAMLCGAICSMTASAEIYYVDSQSGADTNSGVAPGFAWKTLGRVNAQVFYAGDEIRFKAGTR
jgi:hypothetical protein